ncbi:tetratricopeptide repeat protein, partial [Crocosphaera watsonii]|uniref:tetratricopeptide repeat protein n=1 Tax=Crocosphaera watsonii TaxID=263511 RepID=UPI0018CCC84A
MALGNLAFVYSDLGEFSKAIDYHQKAVDIFQEYDGLQGDSVIALNNLGDTYRLLGDYSGAIGVYKEALNLAQEIKFSEEEIPLLVDLSHSYYSLSISKGIYWPDAENFSKSMDYAVKAIKNSNREAKSILVPIEALVGLGNIYQVISIISDSTENYNLALKFYNQALTYS